MPTRAVKSFQLLRCVTILRSGLWKRQLQDSTCSYTTAFDASGLSTSMVAEGQLFLWTRNGQPIEGAEAAARLATFGQGPCPVFCRLAGGLRSTQKVAPIVTFSARVGALISAIRKAWKLSVRRQRPQPRSFAKNLDQRSKRR